MISASFISGPTRQQMVAWLRVLVKRSPEKAFAGLVKMLDQVDNGPVRNAFEGGPPEELRRVKREFARARRRPPRALIA